MRAMMILAVLAAGLMASGCRKMTTSDLPFSMVANQLAALPSNVNALSFAFSVPDMSYHAESTASRGLVWVFTIQGMPICRYFVDYKPKGETGAEIQSWLEMASEPTEMARATGAKSPDHSFLCKLAEKAGDETVTAIAEGRSMDTQLVAAEMRNYMVANPYKAAKGAMMGASDAIDRAMREQEMENYDPGARGGIDVGNDEVRQKREHIQDMANGGRRTTIGVQ